MIVGSVKEIKQAENRVGLIPSHVKTYINAGHSVYVEKGLGIGSGFEDQEYEEAGAILCDDPKDVWEKSELIIKVKEPLESEFKFLRPNLIIFTYLHLADNMKLTQAMLDQKVTSFAYETITDSNGFLPLLKPMSEIAGRLAIKEGEKYLQGQFGGKAKLLSGVAGVAPGHVVVIGTGIVGYNACKTAIDSGARVTVLGIDNSRLDYFAEKFGGIITTLFSTEENIKKAIKDADIIVGSVLIRGDRAPRVIRREHLSLMEKGTVMVDVSIDQGGCFETSRTTTHSDPVFVLDGIVHYCVGNMPGVVSRTSTESLTNATLAYGLKIANQGVKCVESDKGLYNGLNTYNGTVSNKNVANALDLEYIPYEN